MRIVWEVLVVVTVFASGMMFPMALVTSAQGVALPAAVVAAVFLIDMVVREGGRRSGITAPGAIERRLGGGWLLIDLASVLSACFSTYWLSHPGSSSHAIIYLSLLPLLKLLRLDSVFDALEETLGLYPSNLHLVLLVFLFLLGSHLIAAGQILIGGIEPGLTPTLKYVTALYWAVTTLSTVGYGDITPDLNSPTQMFFTMIVMLLGVGMYGYLIGNLASVISNLDAAKTAYIEKMEKVDIYLRFHGISRDLQDRIRGYYRYLWKTHKSTAAPAFMEELPNSLRADLALHLNRDIMEKVPFFANADEPFLREIVQMMQLCIFLPGDLIIRQGEIGDSMFFLSSGEVEVAIDGQVVSTQGAGTFFGEIAVMESTPRKASIRARTYCDVYRLSRKDFDELRSRYEDFDRHVTEISRQRRGDGAR